MRAVRGTFCRVYVSGRLKFHAPSLFQKLHRTPACNCRGSPASVGLRNVDSGSAPVPNVLFSARMLTWLKTLNASTSTSIRLAPGNTNTRDARRSTDELPTCRALFLDTPGGRSLLVVSLFRSLPATTLNGTPLASDTR